MARIDDFSAETVRALRERAGYRCCYPECKLSTVGPSSETESSVSRTGIAAHISAASSGINSRRYDPTLSHEERKHIDNGIWMCANHGTEVDRDENRYTVEVLKHWREVGEARADFAKTHGWEKADKIGINILTSLSPLEINLKKISKSAASKIIGDGIKDSCLPELWGKEVSNITRDLLIELYRNAFDHGSASYFKIKYEINTINIAYNGNLYSIFKMLNEKNAAGGKATLSAILNTYRQEIAVNYHSINQINEISINLVKNLEKVSENLPCTMLFTGYDEDSNQKPSSVHESCGAIYIILRDHFCPSDLRPLSSELTAFDANGRPVFIVGNNISSVSKEAISKQFPDFLLITL